MAKFLYNQYCYEDLFSVKRSIRSEMVIPDFGIVQTVSSVVKTITVDYLKPDGTTSSYSFTPPICQQLGYDNSFTGLTTNDSVEIGGYIVLALVIAYSVKILRRGL